MGIEQIVTEVMKLPAHSRAFLAEKLLESLDLEEDFKVSSEWVKEIESRARAIDDGLVELVPAETAFADLRARYP